MIYRNSNIITPLNSDERMLLDAALTNAQFSLMDKAFEPGHNEILGEISEIRHMIYPDGIHPADICAHGIAEIAMHDIMSKVDYLPTLLNIPVSKAS